MATNQSDNRNRRNLSYGRNNTRGGGYNRERANSDSEPVTSRSDRPSTSYNSNNNNNNNRNGSYQPRSNRYSSPNNTSDQRPETAPSSRFEENHRSSPPAYQSERRRPIPTNEHRGGAGVGGDRIDRGDRGNSGPPARPAFTNRREEPHYQRSEDRPDRRRGGEYENRERRVDYDRERGGDRVDRGGGGVDSSYFSGRPAPYKQDTNKLPRISSTEFFNLSVNDLRTFCENEDNVRAKSYKGELVYKTLLLQLFDDRTIAEKDRKEVVLLRTRYESLFVLSIFLNQGTNFRVILPEFGGRQPDFYGLLVYALLWESAVAGAAKEPSLVNLAPWLPIVRQIKQWIDSHVNFERTYPTIEGKEIVWKTGASADLKWKESIFHEYEYVTPNNDEANNAPVKREFNRTQGQQPPRQQDDRFNGRTVIERGAGGRGRGRGRGGFRGESGDGYEKSEEVEDGEKTDHRHHNDRNDRNQSGEPRTLIYRNVADVTSRVMSALIRESKVYTERYGNTMNFKPNPQSGHEFNDLRIRRTTIFGDETKATWTGAQCEHCDAFLIRAKVNYKFSNLFLFGLTECPKKKANEWVPNYQKRITQAFSNAENPIKDKFNVTELQEWGFIGENEGSN